MKTLLLRSLLFMILAFNIPCQAITLDNLYYVEVDAARNDAKARREQLIKALDTVILKVASQREVLEHERVVEARKNPDKFVKKYAYKNKFDRVVLSVDFNERLINQLVSQLGKVYLGKNRPVIMLWVVKEEDGAAQFLDQESTTQLEMVAHNFGIPVVLPLLDLDEQTRVKPVDVLKVHQATLKEAAQRYHADLVVSGVISKFAGQWRCQWQLLTQEPVRWDQSGEQLDGEFEDFILTLSEYLATKYGSSSTFVENNIKLQLRVEGIKNLSEYAKIMSYLKGLSAVEQVEIANIQGSSIVYNLVADGGVSAVSSAIALDRVLHPVIAKNNPDKNQLVYKVKS